MSIPSLSLAQGLLGEIRALIESARQRATAMVNSELTLLFWRIGRRIYTEVLAGERAGYGEQIVPPLCTGRKSEQIELLELDEFGIHV